jgi:exopolysaccharide production protein ExoQ
MLSGLSKPENKGHGGSPTIGLPFAVGFYFAFRLFIMLLSVRLLGMDPRTGTGLDLALNYLLFLFVAFCSLGEARLQFRQMAKLPGIRWALAFLAFSCCSLLWSSTVSMSTTIAYWCSMAADFAIVIMLFRSEPLTHVAASLMKGYVWGACLIAIIAWLMPAQSDLRLGDEELLGANQIGYLCGFAFFFAQYLMREGKERLGVPALLLAVTLLRTLSKTTIAAFLVAEGFLLIRDKSISRKSRIMILLATAVVVAALWGLLTSYFEIYTNAGTGNQSETLTGRLGIWAYILAEAVQQPWIGHGFDSVWKVIPPFGADQFEAAHAHNELIQQFYAYGLVGVGLFAAYYASLYRHIRRLARGPFRTFCSAFLLFVLVRGFADTERFDLSLPLWAIVILSLLIEHARAAQENASTFMAIEPSPLPIIAQDLSFIPFTPQGPTG